MEHKFNNKPIVPNKSAAGIKLKTTKKTVKKNWGEPIKMEIISSQVERWDYANVSFWFESNKVDQIKVSDLYEGRTKDDIGLGSSKSEVTRAYGSLYWDGTWHINGLPFGIGFDFENDITGEQYVTDIFIFEE